MSSPSPSPVRSPSPPPSSPSPAQPTSQPEEEEAKVASQSPPSPPPTTNDDLVPLDPSSSSVQLADRLPGAASRPFTPTAPVEELAPSPSHPVSPEVGESEGEAPETGSPAASAAVEDESGFGGTSSGPSRARKGRRGGKKKRYRPSHEPTRLTQFRPGWEHLWDGFDPVHDAQSGWLLGERAHNFVAPAGEGDLCSRCGQQWHLADACTAVDSQVLPAKEQAFLRKCIAVCGWSSNDLVNGRYPSYDLAKAPCCTRCGALSGHQSRSCSPETEPLSQDEQVVLCLLVEIWRVQRQARLKAEAISKVEGDPLQPSASASQQGPW